MRISGLQAGDQSTALLYCQYPDGTEEELPIASQRERYELRRAP